MIEPVFTGRIFLAETKLWKCTPCKLKLKRAYEMSDGTFMGVECFTEKFGVKIKDFSEPSLSIDETYESGEWPWAGAAWVHWCELSHFSEDLRLMRLCVYPSNSKCGDNQKGDMGYRTAVGIGTLQDSICIQKWHRTKSQAQTYAWKMLRRYMKKEDFTHYASAIYEEVKNKAYV